MMNLAKKYLLPLAFGLNAVNFAGCSSVQWDSYKCGNESVFSYQVRRKISKDLMSASSSNPEDIFSFERKLEAFVEGISDTCQEKDISLKLTEDPQILEIFDQSNQRAYDLGRVYIKAQASLPEESEFFTLTDALKILDSPREDILDAALTYKKETGENIFYYDLGLSNINKFPTEISSEEFLELVKLKDELGNPYFKQELEKINKATFTIYYEQFKDENLQKMVSPYYPLFQFIMAGGDLEEAKEYMACEIDGKRTINSDRAYRFLLNGYPASKISEKDCQPEFNPTEGKAQYLVVEGFDWNGVMDSKEITDWIKTLKQNGDLRFIITYDKKEALELSSVNGNSYPIGGGLIAHGSRERLGIGIDPETDLPENDGINDAIKTEPRLVGRYDQDFAEKFFSNFSTDASIVYMSCSSANGGLNSIAGEHSKYLKKGQTLIAPEFPLSPKTELKTRKSNLVYSDDKPEEISFKDDEIGDITVRFKSRNPKESLFSVSLEKREN